MNFDASTIFKAKHIKTETWPVWVNDVEIIKFISFATIIPFELING